ncbi:MAG: metallophosphatase family protein [Lachnospiraceae bacterium]
MKVHKIAIISDTHGMLRPEVLEILETCEAILHGGDFNSQQILDALKEIAPVYVVRGNNDKAWAKNLQKELDITLYGVRIYMVHDKQHRRKELYGIDLFVYGHSHKYEEKIIDGVFYLNPGSCGPRRFRLPVTMAILEVEESGSWRVKKIDLMEQNRDSEIFMEMKEKNLKATVETIIREMQAGRKIEQIAKKLCVDSVFVEQICRIYVTHPGVDAQGIVDKMEVSALFERKNG